MLLFLSAIFLYSSSPFMRTRYNFYVAVIAYAGFYLISRLNGQKWRVTGTYGWAGLAALSSGMYFFVGAADRVTTYLSGIVYIFFWAMAAQYLMDNYDKKRVLRFGMVNLMLLLVSVIVTIRVLTDYPLAARAINGRADGITEADVARYIAMGCGGFGFIYGCTIFSMALVTVIKAKCRSWKMRTFAISAYVLIFYMIFLAEFTTALLMAAIVFLICITAGKKRNYIPYLLIAMVALLIWAFSDDVLRFIYYLAQRLGVSYLEHKMGMLLEASIRQNSDGLARAKRYMESIEGILSSPLLGSGKAGGHSQVLDTFSTIGLFAIPYVAMLVNVFKDFAKRINKFHIMVFAGTILTLATLNPFVDSTIVSISFILTPIFLYCFVPQNKT